MIVSMVRCKNLLLLENIYKAERGGVVDIDVGVSRFSILKILTIKSGTKLYISLGKNGLAVSILLLSILKFVLRRDVSVSLLVVGGWLSDYLEASATLKLLFKSTIDDCFVESKRLQSTLKAIIPSVYLLPNFRFSEPALPKDVVSDQCLKFIFSSRVIREKGIFESIESIVTLNHFRPAVLDIYGPISDDINDELFQLVDRYSFINYMGCYLGEDKSISILRGYDFLILPTRYHGECMPGIIVESFAAGTPVVSTNWRDIPEFVDNFLNGYVFDAHNFTDSFVAVFKDFETSSYALMSLNCTQTYSNNFSAKAVVI